MCFIITLSNIFFLFPNCAAFLLVFLIYPSIVMLHADVFGDVIANIIWKGLFLSKHVL
jgi:hypothetical protein